MLKLVQNEWMKIFKRPGTYVMIGLLIIIVSVMSAFIKYQEGDSKPAVAPGWEQQLQSENVGYKQQLDQLGDTISPQKTYLERQLALNEYRLENNLPPQVDYSVWSFVKDASQMIEFAGLFTIIIAAGIVASEFNWGTIKLLLIRPIKRSKILLAKYITVALFGLFMLTILFSFSALVGLLLFGTPDVETPYLSYSNGVVKEQSMFYHLILLYGLKSTNILMLSTMAFMISAVFRNSSLAIGLSLFLMFTGAQITLLLSMRYEWAKYILFANTNLMQYFEGEPLVEGMTLTFSIFVLAVYFILFQALAFTVFKKRDVAA